MSSTENALTVIIMLLVLILGNVAEIRGGIKEKYLTLFVAFAAIVIAILLK